MVEASKKTAKKPAKKTTQGSRKVSFTVVDVADARAEGHAEGLQKGRQEILDWLQNAYLNDPGRPDRGTPKAEAILEISRAAADHFLRKIKVPGRKGR